MQARITIIVASATSAGVAFSIAATSALAHHSNSAYQVDEIITLTGTVKEWQWSNPHTWLHLTVKNDDGAEQEWAVEGRAPGVLRRAGWDSEILKPGETVTVHASPAKDGRPIGIIARVTKADGSILGNQPNFSTTAEIPADAPRVATVSTRPDLRVSTIHFSRAPRPRPRVRPDRCRRRRAPRRHPTAHKAAAQTRRSSRPCISRNGMRSRRRE
jgi:hypothetical protein